MRREPPVWSQQDADYYGKSGVCVKCKQTMKVGEPYWLDSRTMMKEPPDPFHDVCPPKAIEEMGHV